MSSTAIPCAAAATGSAAIAGRGISAAPCGRHASDAAHMGPAPTQSTASTPSSPPDVDAQPSPAPSPLPSESGGKPDICAMGHEGAAGAPHDELDDSSEAKVKASLLLKPFAKLPDNPIPDAAAIMATPQSLQSMNDGSAAAISPLEMLIAALDPQRQPPQHQPYTEVVAPAASVLDCSQQLAMASGMAADGSDMPAVPGQLDMLSGGLWSPGVAVPGDQCVGGISGMAWAAARRVSDAAVLGGYQFGQPAAGDQCVASEPIRAEPYHLGAKRPYGDFEQLLSAAEAYPGVNNTSELAGQPPMNRVRHTIDATATDATSAAAAAAIAAAVLSHSRTLSDATRCETAIETCVPPGTGVQVPCPNTCFDQLGQGPGPGLSLNPGMPLMSGPPLSQVPVGQPLHAYPGHHARSLSLSHLDSPMGAAAMSSAAGQYPPFGYFYEGLGMGALGPGGPNELAALSAAPVPAIPGVTVSPKVKPRRISVPDLSSLDADERTTPKTRPRRQKVRSGEDLYTPTWVRNSGQKKEGFCDTCSPGKWLQLKNSAFWYHKQFSHGISSVSGRPFTRPLQVRHFDADNIEGLCHQCRKWVPIANAKRRNSVLWFRHAHKCHVHSKPKQEVEFGDYPAIESMPAVSAAAVPLEQ
ncbi:hypothetical protein H4R19_001616 [Coemansia spiralis]|nr:hypothetical protein H4R19_001616 [Coemansia spiralis]